MSADTLKELLNSDVFISIEKNTHDINLLFVASWIPQEGISLKCKNVHTYYSKSDPKKNPPFPLGTVEIHEDIFQNRLAKGWSTTKDENQTKVTVVKIEGLIEIEIVCLELEWKIPSSYIME